ncbi:type II toxin-antitoxin system PemK/MazF family toxin [Meiothermus sp.]|uniref:type II toxin-antitoxin system PemK/MazF family toxin n=1 Tax=Meiothermus sp. TaxID=1955249 RepID=UPI00307D4ADA
MRRGELYLYQKPRDNDPRRQRVFVAVGHQGLIDSTYSTVICAAVYSRYAGLKTQVPVGVEEGLKHESTIYHDELTSLEKSRLTNYVGMLSAVKLKELDRALAIALDLPEPEEYEI